MSKYNEQHATTMLNALQGTETLEKFKQKIRADERNKIITEIEKELNAMGINRNDRYIQPIVNDFVWCFFKALDKVRNSKDTEEE